MWAVVLVDRDSSYVLVYWRVCRGTNEEPIILISTLSIGVAFQMRPVVSYHDGIPCKTSFVAYTRELRRWYGELCFETFV